MKYIVIGLGYFGRALATNLTTQGHEVIGVDNRSECAEELKEKISHVLIMDSTKTGSLESLPISDVDAVIVSIGEDILSSILTLSLLRKMKVKRLIGRAINSIHHSILVELGIEEIYHPEEDTAGLVTSMLMIRNAINVLQINDNTLVVEIPVPKIYAGHTLEAVNMESRFDIKPVAVKIAPKDKGMAKLLKKDFAIDLECNRFRPLRDADRLIIIGNMENVKRFIE